MQVLYSLVFVLVCPSVALRAPSCSATDPKCNNAPTTQAVAQGSNTNMMAMGSGSSQGEFNVNIAPFQIPAFDAMPDLNFRESPDFQGSGSQSVEIPQLTSSGTADQISGRTTTTPPPYYTIAIDITNVPIWTTDNLTLYQNFPALDRMNTIQWAGPVLNRLKQIIG
jgi:hypothetical protein